MLSNLIRTADVGIILYAAMSALLSYDRQLQTSDLRTLQLGFCTPQRFQVDRIHSIQTEVVYFIF